MARGLDVHLVTRSGEPRVVGEVTIVPELQSLVVRVPFAAFVWSRPTVVVVRGVGTVDRMPVRDVTRMLQVGMLGFSLVVLVIGLVKRAIERRKDREH